MGTGMDNPLRSITVWTTLSEASRYGQPSQKHHGMDNPLRSIAVWTTLSEASRYGQPSQKHHGMDNPLRSITVWTTLSEASRYGQPSQKHHAHVLNLFTAVAKKGVPGGVSVTRQPSSAPHYVFVLVTVIYMNSSYNQVSVYFQ